MIVYELFTYIQERESVDVLHIESWAPFRIYLLVSFRDVPRASCLSRLLSPAETTGVLLLCGFAVCFCDVRRLSGPHQCDCVPVSMTFAARHQFLLQRSPDTTGVVLLWLYCPFSRRSLSANYFSCLC